MSAAVDQINDGLTALRAELSTITGHKDKDAVLDAAVTLWQEVAGVTDALYRMKKELGDFALSRHARRMKGGSR